jgi:hypothetical protein
MPLKAVTKMPAYTIKAVLDGSPDEVRKKLDELTRCLPPHEYAASKRVSELAAELARDPRLRVSVVTYNDEAQELEVILSGDPHCDSVMLSRSQSGTHCQLEWNRWLPIANDADISHAAALVTAVLESALLHTDRKCADGTD